MKKILKLFLGALILASILLTACAPPPPPITKDQLINAEIEAIEVEKKANQLEKELLVLEKELSEEKAKLQSLEEYKDLLNLDK